MELYEQMTPQHIFFFQAEDGIRDLTVTGVQTCALPIFIHLASFFEADIFVATREDVVLQKLRWFRLGDGVSDRQWQDTLGVLEVAGGERSEERRVGKEGRSRWSPDH